MRDRLILTVGLPRSGKTTWARDYAKTAGCPVVCPDAIRLALSGQPFNPLTEPWVWALAKTMVRSLFYAGHDLVVLDACSVTREQRSQWRDREWDCLYKVFRTEAGTCENRAIASHKDYLIPVISKMASQWESLAEDEVELQEYRG